MSESIQAIIKMLQTLKLMVTANLTKFKVIPAFEATYTEVTTLLTDMETLQQTAVETTKGTTDTKNAYLMDLCKATLAVARPMRALAGKLKDLELKMMMDVKVYKLKVMKPTVLTAFCQNIYDKAKALEGEAKPYNLTEAKLNSLKDLIAAYTAQVPEIRKQMGEINTSKKDIDRLVEDALDLLESQLDPMVETLEETDPTALELWRSARHVVKPTSTTTQLKVKAFTLEGEVFVPMKEIPVIASNGKDYTLITDDLGEAVKKPIPFGTYIIKCNIPDYKPFFLKDYKVVRGKVNKVEVVLVRAAVDG